MRLVISGQLYSLHDLGAEMDAEFLALHAAFLGNQAYSLENLKRVALVYFSSNNNSAAHDHYFNNFTIVWRGILRSGNMDKAELLWQLALEPALDWEIQNGGNYIHKGTPYYFWGITAILKGDIDRGYALIHQSLSEDIRTSGQPSPDTASLALATLDFTKVEQAFRDWVLTKATFLGKLLEVYCSNLAKTMGVNDFRNRLLLNISDKSVVFLFSYALARLLRLSETPNIIRSSNFAGQLQLNLFFDIALVIDAAIKERNPIQWKFIDHLAFLSNNGGFSLDLSKLRDINAKLQNDFNQTITDALDGNLILSDGYHLNRSEDCLAIAYGIRNHGAHSVSSTPVVWQRFPEVQQSLFNTLFIVAETLY